MKGKDNHKRIPRFYLPELFYLKIIVSLFLQRIML